MKVETLSLYCRDAEDTKIHLGSLSLLTVRLRGESKIERSQAIAMLPIK